MTTGLDNEILPGLKKSEAMYNKVTGLSQYIFNNNSHVNRDACMK